MDERTKMGRKIVIRTSGYGVGEGWATQITLPCGKYCYTGVGSMLEMCAKKRDMEIKTVHYYGSAISSNINERAHEKYPIQIDSVSVADFIDTIATRDEIRRYFK